MEKKESKTFFVRNEGRLPLWRPSSARSNDDYWLWGSDNLFPAALAALSRTSTTHRRILNDKCYYITGAGFSFDPSQQALAQIIASANGAGEPLRQVINRVIFDKLLFGNAFLEVVTDKAGSFLSLFHQDASRCRLSKDHKHIVMHHDWSRYSVKEAKTLPLYPRFDESADGTLRSVIHYKDYEPMFENYGVPGYISGMGVSTITYKTDKWNISRLDSSFQLSGVLMLDSSVENRDEAMELVRNAEEKFAGRPGQVMFIVNSGSEGDSSKFIPVNASNDADWKDLHDQAQGDIVIAHSWFRALSGMDFSGGFSSERMVHEYNIALSTVISVEQQEILEPLRRVIGAVTGCDASSLSFVNKAPVSVRPAYMKVWEARKADGLPYDEGDPKQQVFLSKIN